MSFIRKFSSFAFISILVIASSMQSVRAQSGGGLRVITDPDGASVTVSGDAIVSGVTPTTFTQTLIGFYKIEIERFGYEKYKTKVILDPSKMMEINVKLTPKTRFKSAIRSMVIPGWGQRYSNQKYRGFFYTLLAAASTWGYFRADDDFDTKFNRFKSLEEEYDQLKINGSQAQLEELLPRLTTAQERAYDAEDTRRIVIGATIAVWSISVIDALFFFPEEKGTFKVKNVSLTPEANTKQVGLNLSYHF